MITEGHKTQCAAFPICVACRPSTYPGAVADYFPLAESAMVAGIHTKWYEVLNPHNKLDQAPPRNLLGRR